LTIRRCDPKEDDQFAAKTNKEEKSSAISLQAFAWQCPTPAYTRP
jgi:hypothetical protein